MNQSQASEVTTKILAFLGGLALHFCALVNAVIAAMALFTGAVAGAIGEASTHADNAELANSANHTATIAKIVAVSLGVLAALEFGAGEFLRRRVRNIIVPIACGATVVGMVAFSAWIGRFTALDAMLIASAIFAGFVWWKLPVRSSRGLV